jgi:hypothetical protein
MIRRCDLVSFLLSAKILAFALTAVCACSLPRAVRRHPTVFLIVTFVCIHAHVCSCVCVGGPMCMCYAHTRERVPVCVSVCVCMCACVCVCVRRMCACTLVRITISRRRIGWESGWEG